MSSLFLLLNTVLVIPCLLSFLHKYFRINLFHLISFFTPQVSLVGGKERSRFIIIEHSFRLYFHSLGRFNPMSFIIQFAIRVNNSFLIVAILPILVNQLKGCPQGREAPMVVNYGLRELKILLLLRILINFSIRYV